MGRFRILFFALYYKGVKVAIRQKKGVRLTPFVIICLMKQVYLPIRTVLL